MSQVFFFFPFVFVNKANSILDCTERSVASRLGEAVIALCSVLVRYVWCILLGIGALALFPGLEGCGETGVCGEADEIEKLRWLGPGWCDLQGAPEGSWTCLVLMKSKGIILKGACKNLKGSREDDRADLFLIEANNTARGSGHRLQLGRLTLGAMEHCSRGGGWWSRTDCPRESLSTETFKSQLDRTTADVNIVGDSSALKGVFGLDGLQRCLISSTSLILLEL